MKKTGLFGCLVPLFLSGCSFSGLGGQSDYSCKASSGVSCQSISGVSANASQGNLPFQKEDPAKVYGEGDPRYSGQGSNASGNGVPVYGDTQPGSGKVSPRDMVAAHTGMPVRQPPLVVRVWMAPYEDDEKDLHDQSYFYTVVHTGNWMIEANRSNLTNQYRPIYPLNKPSRADSEPADKERQPLVGKPNFDQPLVGKQNYQMEGPGNAGME